METKKTTTLKNNIDDNIKKNEYGEELLKDDCEKKQNRVLSFDVGVLNLAYCIIDKNNDDFKIEKWNLIDLVYDRSVCEHQLRTLRKCGKIGRFTVYDINKKSTVSCKVHKKNYEYAAVQNEKLQCEKCGDKSMMSDPIYKVGWCKKHFEKLSKQYFKEFKPKKITGQDCKQQPIQTLTKRMYTILDTYPEMLSVNIVLIENQPSLLNPMMKTISSVLYGYFIIRGIIDKERTKSTIENVNFKSPSNKLKINKDVTKKQLGGAKNKREEYIITKGLSTLYCDTLIKDSEKKMLVNRQKIDDMCDAFLQGFQYLFDPVPQKYIDLLSKIPIDKLIVNKKKTKQQKSKTVDVLPNIPIDKLIVNKKKTKQQKSKTVDVLPNIPIDKLIVNKKKTKI
jgi:hypothetical protein